ncbi:MAG: BamA/TamA family outer membrane protein [Rhodothermales bacterium]|nr:BamA/TamA family outer membrane protein [Rhodothermales bacterium]MDG2017531.1 BamA/TamA family outer membrane protein [Rhodothermales bacterium]
MPKAFTRILLFLILLFPVGLSFGQYGYHFGRNKIQYEDFEWKVMKTEHFDIYYYPEMLELAEHGAFFAEEAYSELEHRFNFSLNHRVPLIFYSTNLHFKQTNVTSGFIPDGVGGFFEFLKGRVVIPANGNLSRFRRVVRHEMVHVFTFNKVLRVMRDHRQPSDRFLPLWFTEGLAEYWSGEPDHQHEMVIRDAMFTNYLVPLESMYRIRGSFVMYKQGEAISRFISEVYGEERILMLIENIWKDRDFRVVMELTLQEDFSVIADRWLKWLKLQYYPDLAEIEVPSIIADGLSTEGFNAKPNYHRFPDGTRKVYFVGNHRGLSNVFEVEVGAEMQPLSEPKVVINGERSDNFESFHLFESRISVSSQGKLAFVTKSGGKDVLHIYDLNTDRLVATYRFDDLIAVYSPSWSPDEERIVFTAIKASGFSDLFVYHLDDGVLQQITADTYDDRDPSWSPTGDLIAFSSDRTYTGNEGHYNLFTYDTDGGHIRYVTQGARTDLSPTWSPDGSQLAFISTRRDSTGRFGAQDVWVTDMDQASAREPMVAQGSANTFDAEASWRPARRLTSLVSAAFDPVWAEDNHIIFTSFEGLGFSIRQLSGLDSLMTSPKEEMVTDVSRVGVSWSFDKMKLGVDAEPAPYRSKYKLDLAQGAVSQNPILGTTGGAMLAFSDMMGNDYLYLTIFNTGTGQRNFLKDVSLQLSRFKLNGRANLGYGLYRHSGRRYDVTDPDAPTKFPVFFETVYGGFGMVSYPLSKFTRIELTTSLNWSRKDISFRGVEREALMISNYFSLVRDNAQYWMNGPVAGWRASITAGYTSDILYSNVSYYTLMADVRKYFRITQGITFASWVMGRVNEGREARLFVLGGSWDLRGFNWFDVRGQKMWFTSHELRFPLINAPTVLAPILAPLGIASLRGTLFFDAAHAWNTDYYEKRQELRSGETVGSIGFGFRLNLFGAFVLRYDIGNRYGDGFRTKEKAFKQFFFGWNF